MSKTAVVITSIAGDTHAVLKQYAKECAEHEAAFIVVGDTKSPIEFNLPGCDFYSLSRQTSLDFSMVPLLPERHYARKNLGYLIAIKNGIDIIVETDDDNIPLPEFWSPRAKRAHAQSIADCGWVNVYSYFSRHPIWPRGFSLEHIRRVSPQLGALKEVHAPVQQGLADDNPDVDAIYRLTQPLPLRFERRDNVGLQPRAVCPFNSQNTTWFAEAFPLLYLPSYCSFRMTDIWRSFVAQRIMWEYNWTLLFHNSTVRQERNDHSLIADFQDEISGYLNNDKIMNALASLKLPGGVQSINDHLLICYEELVALGFIDAKELPLLATWISDLEQIKQTADTSGRSLKTRL
jgi:hypothetical protein